MIRKTFYEEMSVCKAVGQNTTICKQPDTSHSYKGLMIQPGLYQDQGKEKLKYRTTKKQTKKPSLKYNQSQILQVEQGRIFLFVSTTS